jgi:hypothetical protein
MGINATILHGIWSHTNDYGFLPCDVEGFLTNPSDFLTRQANAISIIEDIMTAHGKQELLRHVVQLAKVEHGIGELEPRVRDHVVHALLSFLLGVLLNEYFLKPDGLNVGAFQWKLAGLFHDVGYPAQIAKDILRPYTDEINNIKRALSVTRPDVFFRIGPVGLDELANKLNSLDLIQEWLDMWGLKIDARSEYTQMIDSGGVCHGMISALSVLYIIDMMYQKYNSARTYIDIYDPPNINWNQSYFENDVVPACAAIFVHNLPSRCFQLAPLDRSRAPLPFLLRLSDCLQDWDRPSADDPTGVPDTQFDINVISGRLRFKVSRPDRRLRIAEQIQSSIVALGVEIV